MSEVLPIKASKTYNASTQRRMSDIKEIQKDIIKFRDDRNWKQFHDPKSCTIHLMRETIEVLDHFLHKSKKEADDYSKLHKKEIGEELSDVLYWTLLIAHDLNIDVKKSFHQKMIQNRKKYPVDKSKGKRKKYTDL